MASLFEQEFLVVDLPSLHAHFVNRAELDRILRAGFFAHAAEATTKNVDFEFDGVLFFIRALACFDVDTFRRANSWAKHTSGAVLNAVGGLDVVHAAESIRVLTTFFRIRDGDSFAEKHLVHRLPHPCENIEDVEA